MDNDMKITIGVILTAIIFIVGSMTNIGLKNYYDYKIELNNCVIEEQLNG